ncbi:MAG: 2OG-Fe(II) oxygenase family protein, partial [Gammaproteobacteria bacterium]|nr:2OG-Fe(II) oxygenase family protein [Gammaproteobacteria bacterium]
MTAESPPDNALDEQGFRQLWPVLFMQRTLPGHEQANRALEQTILCQEAAHQGLTTDYVQQNLFAGQDPAISWLMQCIHKSATDYCQRAGMAYAIDWTLQGWANVNRRGDYHDPHNHPHAYLSGTY